MRNNDKALLEALGERYVTIEHDGGYCLYDKERPSMRANYKYIGKFYISSDKKRYVFNERYYLDVESMVAAMDEYAGTLPFDIEIYNPIYKASYRIECALHDYLRSLGFESSQYNQNFILYDCYKQAICELGIEVKDGSTVGAITRRVGVSVKGDVLTTESPFVDLDSAIASVNTILSTYVVSVNSVVMNVMGKITSSRSAILLDRTFDVKKLAVYTKDGRKKMIEVLEKELDSLKRE